MARKPVKIRRRRPGSSEMSGFGPLLMVAIVAVALFNLDAAGVFIVGLAPTIVLAFTGKGIHKALKLHCVGFMNIAGIIPFAWNAAHSSNMETVISNPINLAIMFGAAAIGYLLIHAGPMVAAIVLQSLAQDKIKQLNQQRTLILETWGSDVMGDSMAPAPEPDWASKGRGGMGG